MEILSSRVLIRPTDYQRSVAFYRDDLGLAIAREYSGGTIFHAGQSLIEIAGHGGGPPGPTQFPGALWLQVRDLAAIEKQLRERGLDIAREARREPWGLLEMHVTDPDGLTLIIVQVPEDHPLRRDTRG